MTPTLTTPEHITRGEFDMRLKRLEENKEYKEELVNYRHLLFLLCLLRQL